MVLESLTFLPRSVIARGERRHVWITTATWIHAWITTATWGISPWLQAAERASLFSHTLPPRLSSAHLFNSVDVLSLDDSHKTYVHTHTHTLAWHRYLRSNKAGDSRSSGVVLRLACLCFSCSSLSSGWNWFPLWVRMIHNQQHSAQLSSDNPESKKPKRLVLGLMFGSQASHWHVCSQICS